MSLLETSEGSIFVARRGASNGLPPLVGIHGAGGLHQHWGFQLRALSELTEVVLLDLPGHGRSPGAGRATIADYSTVVVAVLDALGFERATLAGHSMGGAIALHTAIDVPERVAGLVLASTGARLRASPQILDQLRNDPAEAVRMVVEWCYGSQASAELLEAGRASFAQTDPMVFYHDLLACGAFDLRAELRRILCPVLVLCGDEDNMTPPRWSEYLAEQIPETTLRMFANAGHMLPVEQPAEVNNTIYAWLTSQYRNG